MNVYYDFIFPKEGEIEPGLFRNYFKYGKEELLAFIDPIFKNYNKIHNFSHFIKKVILKYHKIITKLPLALYYGKTKPDLLHFFVTLPYLCPFPWISEIESIDQYAQGYQFDTYSLAFKKNLLKLIEHPNCKYILANSIHIKDSFRALGLPMHKFENLYPAVVPMKQKIHCNNNRFNLLFNFGSHPLFYTKGGAELVTCFNNLKKRYNISLTIAGNDSPSKLNNFLTDDIQFVGFINRELLYQKYYPMTDILVHPTHMDSFGFVILEAMSFGIPVVATKHFTIPEIITDGENGYLIDDIKDVWYDENYIGKPNYRKQLVTDKVIFYNDEFDKQVNNLTKALVSLLEDSSLRQRLGNNNYNEIKTGRFSLSYRNKKLFDIYSHSIQN